MYLRFIIIVFETVKCDGHCLSTRPKQSGCRISVCEKLPCLPCTPPPSLLRPNRLSSQTIGPFREFLVKNNAHEPVET